MIKMLVTTSNGPVLLLGITRTNITRMLDRDPILVRGKEVGVKGLDITLMAGETYNDIIDELQQAKLIDATQAAAIRAAMPPGGD